MAHYPIDTTTSREPMKPTEDDILEMANHLDIKSAKHGWYMGIRSVHRSDDFFYLHKDGKIRGTATYGGKFTGYWPTEAEARAFHAEWKQGLIVKHNAKIEEEKQEKINALKERRGNKISMRDIIGKLKENGYN